MNFVTYSSWDQLAHLDNAALAEAEQESIFYSQRWFENLANNALETHQSVLIACIIENTRILAVLPLMTRGNNGLYALSHRCTTHFSLLITRRNPGPVFDCLAKGLSRLPFDFVSLAPVDKHDAILNGLRQALAKYNYSCSNHFRFYNWIHRLEGQSFQAYMASRPSRVRSTLARKKRKLEREHGYEVRLYTGDKVPPAMADYSRIYTASWKATELDGAILDGLAVSFSVAGWARFAVLYVAEQPVAAQIWFVANRKAHIYRLVHDEAWRQYSPGSILTEYLMKYVIESDKVDQIDFLNGNERYKQDWMSERRERYLLSCVKNQAPESKASSFIGSVLRIVKRQKWTNKSI